MNENAPPPGAGTAPGAGDAARGMPYYEKLRRDLRETLQKKRALDQSLVSEILLWLCRDMYCRSSVCLVRYQLCCFLCCVYVERINCSLFVVTHFYTY